MSLWIGYGTRTVFKASDYYGDLIFAGRLSLSRYTTESTKIDKSLVSLYYRFVRLDPGASLGYGIMMRCDMGSNNHLVPFVVKFVLLAIVFVVRSIILCF